MCRIGICTATPNAPQNDGHFLDGIKDLPHPEERSTGARLEGRTAPIQRPLHPSVLFARAARYQDHDPAREGTSTAPAPSRPLRILRVLCGKAFPFSCLAVSLSHCEMN